MNLIYNGLKRSLYMVVLLTGILAISFNTTQRANTTNNLKNERNSTFNSFLMDSDGDGIDDSVDIDDDNDGILDIDEMERCQNNLIFNGDFDLGTTGFTSDYNITTSGFNVGDANVVHYNDYNAKGGIRYQYESSGSSLSNAFAFRTSSLDDDVWCQTVNLERNTHYIFNYEIARIGQYFAGDQKMVLYADGIKIDEHTIDLPVFQPFKKDNYTAIFSGNKNQIELCLRIEPAQDLGYYFLDYITLFPNDNRGTSLEGQYLCHLDSDNDGIPNHLDDDSDNDGCTDAYETRTTTTNSTNISLNDFNNDGLLDIFDNDGDGIPNSYPIIYANAINGSSVTVCNDTDRDGITNSIDLDDDNDGITDVEEMSTAPANGDTDGDGIPDHLDLDSDNDGINDVREANGQDTNNDGFADGAVNGNGIPSSAGNGLNPPDTDIDGQPDFQDLDSDNDSISDLEEGGSFGPDTDNDGVIDGPDTDNDGIRDPVDGLPANFGDANDNQPKNTDNDSAPDYRDPDSDDPNESTVGTTDGNNDDIDDGNRSPLDANNDGLIDNSTDTDDDGIPQVDDNKPNEFGGSGGTDSDGDGIPDVDDIDDDNDGITDVEELSTAPANGDTDGDGIPDHLDLDSDDDGINDVIEADGVDNNHDGMADGAPDNNGVPNTAAGGLNPPDTDGDGQPDFQDLDSDNDTISDLVEGGSNGPDTDKDGVIDAPDTDNDGIKDPVDGNLSVYGDRNDPDPTNSDSDPVPDFRDPDSDDPNESMVGNTDGIDDDIDDQGNSPLDANGDGLVDNPLDSDDDGIPQVVDGKPVNFGGLGPKDSDGDGIPDDDDLDDDNDGITDLRELATAPANGDTDGDGIIDPLDLDSDDDGINDVDEADGTDIDRNGIADGTPNADGIPSSAGNGLNPPDTDGDGQPDFQDLDSDNDGLGDIVENGVPNVPDTDDNGVIDGPDADGDGIKDPVDTRPTMYGDIGNPLPDDTDREGTPDYRDVDSDDANQNDPGDGDGVGDDIGDNNPNDTNDDGLIDNARDNDDDGIADVIDDLLNEFGGISTNNSGNNNCPDLSPVITIVPNTITGESDIEIRVLVSELGNQPTTGPIEVIIPFDSRLTFTYNSGMSSAANQSITNSNWTYLGNNGVVHRFQYIPSSLAAGASSAFGLLATYDPENTSGKTSVTSTVIQNSGGECIVTNNTDAEELIYFD